MERKVICKMVCTNEDSTEQVNIRQGENIIGRNFKECGVVLKDLSVSQRHCKLVIKDKRGFITDMNSKNGVFLNEQRIPMNQQIEFNLDKDQLEISQLNCRFVFEEEAEPSSRKPKSAKGSANGDGNKKGNEAQTKKALKISKPPTFMEDPNNDEETNDMKREGKNEPQKKELPKKNKSLHRYLDSESSDNQTKSQSEAKSQPKPKILPNKGKAEKESKDKGKNKEEVLKPLLEHKSGQSGSEESQPPKKEPMKKKMKSESSLKRATVPTTEVQRSRRKKEGKGESKSKKTPNEPKPPKEEKRSKEKNHEQPVSGRGVSDLSSPCLKIPRGSKFTIIVSGVGQVHSPLYSIVIENNHKSDYSICVMDEFMRTFKLLYSIANGKYIVSKKWLDECGKTRQVLAYMDYLLEDPDNPGQLRKSVEKAKKGGPKIFNGMQFFLLKADFHMVRKEIFDLIDACGGTNISLRELEYPKEKTIIVVPQDLPRNGNVRKQAEKYLKQGYHVQSIEMILNSCLRQTLQLEAPYTVQ